jgi:hypothetical protein
MRSNWSEVEHLLEETYVNKVVKIDAYTKAHGLKSYTGKVDRISLDYATSKVPKVIFFLDAQNRFEVEYDDLEEAVTKLN